MVFHLRSSRHSKDRKRLLKRSTVASLSRQHSMSYSRYSADSTEQFSLALLVVSEGELFILEAASSQRNHPVQKVPVNYPE